MKSVQIDIEQAAFDSVCQVECPHCHYERDVEPDCWGIVECEGCGKAYQIYGAC